MNSPIGGIKIPVRHNPVIILETIYNSAEFSTLKYLGFPIIIVAIAFPNIPYKIINLLEHFTNK